MTGWMTVELWPLSVPQQGGELEGVLAIPATGCQVVARPSWHPARGVILDEHFVVDADHWRQARWLGCADVLYGHRRRWDEAAAWLAQVTSAHGGCGLAASMLDEGGWAVQAGAAGPPVWIRAWPRQPALISCLHGWIVAGGRIEELMLGAAPPGVRHGLDLCRG